MGIDQTFLISQESVQGQRPRDEGVCRDEDGENGERSGWGKTSFL